MSKRVNAIFKYVLAVLKNTILSSCLSYICSYKFNYTCSNVVAFTSTLDLYIVIIDIIYLT